MMTKEQEMLELLRDVKDVLDAYQISFWLECGTLLGAVRDGTFIPWEKDIDFSVWNHDVPDKARHVIADELRAKGFSVWNAESHMNIRKQSGCHTDINFYDICGDKAVMPAYMPRNLFGRILNIWLPSLMEPAHPRDLHKLSSKSKRFLVKTSVDMSRMMPSVLRRGLIRICSSLYKRFGAKDISWVVPMKYFSAFSTMTFYDQQFGIPENVEDYLAFRYGSDWHVPTQDWIHHEHDGACREAEMTAGIQSK